MPTASAVPRGRFGPGTVCAGTGFRLGRPGQGTRKDMEHRPKRREEDEPTLRGALRPPGPVRFEITQIQEPGIVRLAISGELDILTTPRMATELNSLVRRSTEDVVVDLRDTSFIDSAGLQILLGTRRRLARMSRRLTVLCDDGPVLRVIQLTRLEDAFGLRGGEEKTTG